MKAVRVVFYDALVPKIRMDRCCKRHVRADHDAVLQRDRRHVHQNGVIVDKAVLSDMDVFAVLAVERRKDAEILPDGGRDQLV